MSEATDKLARSRRAIVDHIARRERKHDPHEEAPPGYAFMGDEGSFPPDDDAAPTGGGWFRHLQHVVQTWWRYHPAHMAVDLASPMLRNYARRKPWQLLAISAAAGAALTFARPWKLISLGGLTLALLKSSQVSSLLMAALSAADFRKDEEQP
ncbi:hypothetical protein HHL11_08640 [Ramlibacter sp. G-1-2-2]|uniref:Uncharacterized protein n=1 Tax=Ramlibacter agri TaxID=2728837 RepID=A0A848H5E8_9BURK|nr:hypothetical protein [Ramlibacter agri]NML43813.1 hypothetical protein [Ramlibacter agri]